MIQFPIGAAWPPLRRNYADLDLVGLRGAPSDSRELGTRDQQAGPGAAPPRPRRVWSRVFGQPRPYGRARPPSEARQDTLGDCMSFSDPGTHMSKSEWRQTCQRTLNGQYFSRRAASWTASACCSADNVGLRPNRAPRSRAAFGRVCPLDDALTLVLRHGAQEGQEAPAERRCQVQVGFIEHLHQGAPGVDALDDRHAVDHAAGTTIPLSQHQYIASAKGADCLLELQAH